jgi:MFS transporter, AAHS family, 3-hydroxyphenylpropionic acid transporter
MSEERNPGTAALTVGLCFLGALCEGFDVQAAGVTAGGLSRQLRPTPIDLSAFFAASGAGLLLGAIVGGRLADRFGRKVVLVVSLITFGCLSLLTSFAPAMPSLTAARFLTGLGLGGAMPNLIALAADSSSARRLNTSIASAYVGMPLGGSLASLVVFFIPLEQWRVVFQVGGVAPLIVAALLSAYLPAGMASNPTTPGGNSQGMLRALFGEGRAARTLLLWAAFLLSALTLHLMLNWLPLLLSGRGLTKGPTALAQAAFGAGATAAALWVGVLLDARWQRTSIIVSIVVLPVVLVLIAQAPPQPALMLCLALALGSAILAGQVIVYAIANASYAARVRGTGIGAAVAAGRFGSLVGPLFAGALLTVGRTPSQVLIGVVPIVLASGLCVALLTWYGLGPYARSESAASPVANAYRTSRRLEG